MSDTTSALPWATGADQPASASAIGLYARRTAGFEARLEATVQALRQAAAEHPSQVVLANSLGAEDMVLTDLIARHQLPIAIGTLQTGALHEETLALVPRIEQRYGLKVELYEPVQEAVVQFVRDHGEKAMYESIALRKACCQVRKLEPLGRMLEGRAAWVTGLRREQSGNRSAMPLREVEANGRVKFNPLVDWTWADVWHHIAEHEVPYNVLRPVQASVISSCVTKVRTQFTNRSSCARNAAASARWSRWPAP